jgi:hypothetical protein
MNNSLRRVRNVLIALLGFVMLLTSFTALMLFKSVKANADTAENNYYYDQLTPEAKRFYNAIKAMDEAGTLKSGKGEYDLIANNVVTSSQLAKFSQDSDVMVAFGAARDAYSMDHPELFYIEMSYLSINVGTKGGNYVATLGTGRADNYYIEDGFSSEAEINAAITAFNAKVDEIVTAANNLSTTADKVTYVDNYLATNVLYTFIPEDQSAGSYIHNPYGALVNNAAVCEGYARAFKVIMDKLDIPCVIVQGYARTSDDDAEEETWDAHMWNNVRIDNLWYGIDSTWDSTWGNSTGVYDKYLLKGSIAFNAEHSADTVVSAVGFEFSYPFLNAYNYNATAEDTNGFEFTFTQSDVNTVVKVSYEGKGAKALATEGKYLAVKFTYDGATPEWWCPTSCEYTFDEDTDTYTQFTNYASTYNTVQFAVFTVAPDLYNDNFEATYQYSAEPAAENVVAMTAEIGNGASSKKVSTPFAIKVTPSNSSALDPSTESYEFEIQYSEQLRQDNSVEKVDVKIENASGVSLIGDNRVKIENFTWEGDTVKFTLYPSKQLSDTDYIITLDGLLGKDTNLAPDAVSYRFWRKSTVCSKVFNDGRLWMNVYGTPNLVADDDLSVEGWTDSNGNYVSQNQRSQLMLVASKPDDTTSATMTDMAQEEMGVASSDILKSQTYEIDLLLCGCVQTIPNGSYMQVGFGFPEGYGPEDAGATFKVFHYISDGNGNITGVEEVPCVVTEYGIIATVKSFSPYAIVAVKSSAIESTTKSIYARTVGLGGSVTGGLQQIEEGNSVTYTFTPNSGYKVERVILNGETKAVNGATSVTYSYAELEANNVLEVYFVAESVAAKEEAEGITPVYPSLKVNLAGVTTSTEANSSSPVAGWVIAVIIVAALFVVAAIVMVALKLFRRRR